jgi:hypothetical protein
MVKRNRRPAAFKHGAYSQTDVLPGEDAAAFNKLHDDLVAEFLPHGVFEENIVADLARLCWRKLNMATYRLAERARSRHAEISEMSEDRDYDARMEQFVEGGRLGEGEFTTREETRAEKDAVDEQARQELGEAWDLIEVGDVATLDYLLKELSVAERLDGMIDRALKRLLFVRGIKSYQTSSSERIPRSIKAPDAA